MAKNIEALLFDLGGVVIQNDINRIFARWAEHAGCDLADIRKKISFNEYYTRCECGETDITGYFAHLRTTHGINISDKQFLDGWNSIFVGEMPGISLLLEKAKANFPLYAFTNTDRSHERVWSVRFSSVLSHFKRIFVSSTIGMRKPHAAAFNYVVQEIGVSASRIMFFDDVRENVEGAIASGLQAVQVKETADVAAVIDRISKPQHCKVIP